MSWVSKNKLQSLVSSMRNKFTSENLVIANSDKSQGASLSLGGQDGLVTMSPLVDGSTAGLQLANKSGDIITGISEGILSCVDNTGSETVQSHLNLNNGLVTVSGAEGNDIRISGIADPVNDNDAVNKKMIENFVSLQSLSDTISETKSNYNSYENQIMYVSSSQLIEKTIYLEKGIYAFTIKETINSMTPTSIGYPFHIITIYSTINATTTHLACLIMPGGHGVSTYRYIPGIMFIPENTDNISIGHDLFSTIKVTALNLSLELSNLKRLY